MKNKHEISFNYKEKYRSIELKSYLNHSYKYFIEYCVWRKKCQIFSKSPNRLFML